MRNISCVFLCGDLSPYGKAHLSHICSHFKVKAIVIADKQRWTYFRSCLTGGEIPDYSSTSTKILVAIKKIVKKPLEIYKNNRHRKYLESFGVPVIVLNDVNSNESINKISKFSPEILLSAAYPQIFSQNLISSAPNGAVNFHPSLLPRCRGAHPHYWCLATGEEQGGVTAHFMTSSIDDGDIIAQRSFSLDGLYYVDLYKKLIELTPKLVEDVKLFLNNTAASAIPQDANSVTYFTNDREIHKKLDFSRMSAQELYNRIRAGGAYTFHRGARLYIERIDIVDSCRHMTNDICVAEGTIVDINKDGVLIFTKDQRFLVIKSVRWGRKSKPFSAWVAKFSLNIGEMLA